MKIWLLCLSFLLFSCGADKVVRESLGVLSCESGQFLKDGKTCSYPTHTLLSCKKQSKLFKAHTPTADSSCRGCPQEKFFKEGKCVLPSKKQEDCAAGKKFYSHTVNADSYCSYCLSGKFLANKACRPVSDQATVKKSCHSEQKVFLLSDGKSLDNRCGEQCFSNADPLRYLDKKENKCKSTLKVVDLDFRKDWDMRVEKYGTKCDLPSVVTDSVAREDILEIKEFFYEYDYQVLSNGVRWICRYKNNCRTDQDLFTHGANCAQKNNLMKNFVLAELVGEKDVNFEDIEQKDKGKIFSRGEKSQKFYDFGFNKVVKSSSSGAGEKRFMLKGYQSAQIYNDSLSYDYKAGGFNPLTADLLYKDSKELELGSVFRYSIWVKYKDMCGLGAKSGTKSTLPKLYFGASRQGIAIPREDPYFVSISHENEDKWRLLVAYLSSKVNTVAEHKLAKVFTTAQKSTDKESQIFLDAVTSGKVSFDYQGADRNLESVHALRVVNRVEDVLSKRNSPTAPDSFSAPDKAKLKECGSNEVETLKNGSDSFRKHFRKFYFFAPRIERIVPAGIKLYHLPKRSKLCASEGKKCSCTGNLYYGYGLSKKNWYVIGSSGSKECSNKAFGYPFVYNETKTCYCD